MGRPMAFDPIEVLAAGLAMGRSLPTTPGRRRQSGLVRPGVVTAWLELAAHVLFADLARDPLADALASWAAWAGYIGRVHSLNAAQLGAYLDDCGARADELKGTVPAG